MNKNNENSTNGKRQFRKWGEITEVMTSKTEYKSGVNQIDNALKKVLFSLRIIGIIALLGIVLMGSLDTKHICAFIGFSFLLIGGASLTGAIFGFIFGIPKIKNDIESKSFFESNTNLEDVSDWLTKIIIGIGLIELNKIVLKFNQLVISLENSFNFFGCDGCHYNYSRLYLGCLLIFSFAYGFLICYLYTRLFLPILFVGTKTITDEITAKFGEMESKLNNVTSQSEKNAAAWDLVEKQINTGLTDPVSLSELEKTIMDSSPYLKSVIYHKIRQNRAKAEEFTSEVQRNKVRSSIPILEALIKADKDEMFPTNYAQLGFIYMTIMPAEYSKAVECLNKAIAIRDKASTKNEKTIHYEYARAVCNIHLFNQNKTENKSVEELTKLIIMDLSKLKSDPDFKYFEFPEENKAIDSNKTYRENWLVVRTWMESNPI